MRQVNQKSWNSFTSTAATGAVSFLITFMTIVGFGWRMHKEIITDVAAMQAQSNKILEQMLVEKIQSKMDREPSNFQLTDQGRQLNDLKVSMEKSNTRIENLDKTLQEIKSMINKKDQQ